jgi:hypothetical protein
MKIRLRILSGLMAVAAGGLQAQDFLDRLDETLTVSAAEDVLRFRVSGALDLEAYQISQPAPGLIYAPGNGLFNPRLTLFLDAQYGPHLYAFVQSRADRGFDPSDDAPRMRLDEYAVRIIADNGRFNFQIGKFATVVGSWVPRHLSWENPFVTAPLPYENLTAIWNIIPARTGIQLINWAHTRPGSSSALEYFEKPRRTPIIWGPSYASGAAMFGVIGRIKYAFEVKNDSVASHPATWDIDDAQWQHPAFNGHVSYRPNEMWNLGFSAATGPYLQPAAAVTIPPNFKFGDYREELLGQDIGFAWHHLQLWTEFFETRFTNPEVGDAETFAYYTEAKYKFTPQFFGAVRWNQQWFGTVATLPGIEEHWGRDTWRIDIAPTYRFTPHTQIKLQYSFQHESNSSRSYNHIFATQFTLRF